MGGFAFFRADLLFPGRGKKQTVFSGGVQFAKLHMNLKIERPGHGNNSMP